MAAGLTTASNALGGGTLAPELVEVFDEVGEGDAAGRSRERARPVGAWHGRGGGGDVVEREHAGVFHEGDHRELVVGEGAEAGRERQMHAPAAAQLGHVAVDVVARGRGAEMPALCIRGVAYQLLGSRLV